MSDTTRKPYSDWVTDYPETVVLSKERFLYVVYNESALVIGNLLGYSVRRTQKGNLCTGGPNKVKIMNKLTENQVSYVVIENNMVVDHETFTDNHFNDFLDDSIVTDGNKKAAPVE